MAEYKLSASLAGHEDDVRAVFFPDPKAVISASRDGTVRLWKILSDSPPIFDATISSHSQSFVNTVAYLPPSPPFPEGLIISGGKETIIEVRQPLKGPEENAEALLLGHSHNVCALDVDPEGKYIVSGSWDSEARVWPVGKWECEAVLRGHQGSVWAVLAFDSETIITGCVDKLIRVFHKSGKLLRTIRGSQDVVRALCRIPKTHPSGADFASASNDGIIRLWTIGGKQVGELHGHNNFIYALASSPNGELFSSGEDRTLRIWKGFECIQTITHPAISVWGVAVCAENGDIVSGASDRIVRVFSRSPERVADAETTRMFEESVRESSIPQQQLGDVNKEKLPGPEFLTQKRGTKDGQVQMIKEFNGSVTAYMWSAAKGAWDNVGTVVDAVGSSGKKVEYLGKSYDYVFDVDIEDGKPPLKLPYNLSQNPYEAATKFIQDNKLPITYLDQVANFITTNTQGATIGQQESLSAGPEAWGSEARYRPGDGAAPTPAPVAKQLPHKNYLTIISAAVPKIQKKIEELNQALIANGKKDVSLNPSEITTLRSLCRHLEASGATTTSQSIIGGLNLAVKLTTQWPYSDRMPGLDLLRLLAVAPETATFTNSRGLNILDILESGSTEQTPPADNHIMMAIRGIANLFETPEGRALVLKEFEKVQAFLTTSLSTSSTNRNLLIAAATTYINYAVLFNADTDSASFEYVIAALDALNKILAVATDSEVIFRSLVAVGTLLTVGPEARSAAKDVFDLGKSVEGAVKKAGEPRNKVVAREIGELLK